MEKRKSHYVLDDLKQAFAEVDDLHLSQTALRDAIALGLTRFDIVTVIQALTVRQLHKSMTSDRDHGIWQDVYHASYQGLSLYVKFTVDDEGYFLISFKEK
jgi:motility quorum-sensing regulator/GCU-specific mRNA interferase toxin